MCKLDQWRILIQPFCWNNLHRSDFMLQNVKRLWYSCKWRAYFHWKCSDHNFEGWGLKFGDQIIFWHLQRHFLVQNRVVWRIKRKNPLRGLTCRCVEEKKAYINKKFWRIFHPFAEKPPWRNLHKILHDGSPRRRNQPCQILSQSV